MYDNIAPPPEEEKKKTNVWLIVGIVLILLCCCLLVLGLGGKWLWDNGDALLGITQILTSSIA
ncbi:MAG: hypothetical protein L3J16_05285 [Anaerolineales bacterium]|nr:hypothetical protein [Anaerolineales bacterium]